MQKILIIEDDVTINSLLRGILQKTVIWWTVHTMEKRVFPWRWLRITALS